jgi:hypothetical protein
VVLKYFWSRAKKTGVEIFGFPSLYAPMLIRVRVWARVRNRARVRLRVRARDTFISISIAA